MLQHAFIALVSFLTLTFTAQQWIPGTFEELIIYNTEGEEFTETLYISPEAFILNVSTTETYSVFDLDAYYFEDGALYPEIYSVTPVPDPSQEYNTIHAFTIKDEELIPTIFETVKETIGDSENCEAMTETEFYSSKPAQAANCTKGVTGVLNCIAETISSQTLICQTVKECTLIGVPRIGVECLCRSTTACRQQSG